MRHGEQVSAFEREFAAFVGAKYCVAMVNGTVTIESALVALGLNEGERVYTTPLTMAATTIAILNAGGVPEYRDVDPATWLMNVEPPFRLVPRPAAVPVSLYGLHMLCGGPGFVDDAAQTLRRHGNAAFTSYSLQRSKIINTGEGGALVTNDEALAVAAREYASLGYKLGHQSRIDSNAIKSPTFNRHYLRKSNNFRMNDVTAKTGLEALELATSRLVTRRLAAECYRQAIQGCELVTPQFVPEGWSHDYWAYAVACDSPERASKLSGATVKHGGEKPYPAWKLTYHEPAFRHLNPNGLHYSSGYGETKIVPCPNAESLQPRLLQFATNSLSSAEQNASALRRAIEELS